MNFFDSDVVRAEMVEIQELQEEDQQHHIEVLEKLLEKQQIMYTRLSLSDDPSAKKMKEEILKSATMMGLPSDVDVNWLFKNMTEMIGVMKQHLDKTS